METGRYPIASVSLETLTITPTIYHTGCPQWNTSMLGKGLLYRTEKLRRPWQGGRERHRLRGWPELSTVISVFFVVVHVLCSLPSRVCHATWVVMPVNTPGSFL